LREVIAQIETEKNRIRGDIASNVRENMFPILERLSATKENQLHVEMLRRFLSDLASSFGGKLAEVGSGLTAKEKEICRMIKGGLSSKEIAGLLAISPQTVEKHRKNIRKKLGITARGANLGSYLDTL
jgi:DNA-binding CsgD family transcriptional regulator